MRKKTEVPKPTKISGCNVNKSNTEEYLFWLIQP